MKKMYILLKKIVDLIELSRVNHVSLYSWKITIAVDWSYSNVYYFENLTGENMRYTLLDDTYIGCIDTELVTIYFLP